MIKQCAPLVLALPLCGLAGTAQASDNWNLMLEPYVLATSIEGDAALGRVGQVDVDVGFDTILDNLDAAGMLHGEFFHRSGWGLFFDWGKMDLKGDKRTDRGGRLDVRVKQSVTQLGLMYHMAFSDGAFWDVFLGARHWENELRLKINTGGDLIGQQTLRAEPDWTDGFIGGRYSVPFAQNWRGFIYGDIGMGDSDFTADAKAGVVYSFSDMWQLEVGYNALWVDFEEGRANTPGHFLYDTVTHGPLVGLQIHF